jgi:hypothetical protein
MGTLVRPGSESVEQLANDKAANTTAVTSKIPVFPDVILLSV